MNRINDAIRESSSSPTHYTTNKPETDSENENENGTDETLSFLSSSRKALTSDLNDATKWLESFNLSSEDKENYNTNSTGGDDDDDEDDYYLSTPATTTTTTRTLTPRTIDQAKYTLNQSLETICMKVNKLKEEASHHEPFNSDYDYDYSGGDGDDEREEFDVSVDNNNEVEQSLTKPIHRTQTTLSSLINTTPTTTNKESSSTMLASKTNSLRHLTTLKTTQHLHNLRRLHAHEVSQLSSSLHLLNNNLENVYNESIDAFKKCIYRKKNEVVKEGVGRLVCALDLSLDYLKGECSGVFPASERSGKSNEGVGRGGLSKLQKWKNESNEERERYISQLLTVKNEEYLSKLTAKLVQEAVNEKIKVLESGLEEERFRIWSELSLALDDGAKTNIALLTSSLENARNQKIEVLNERCANVISGAKDRMEKEYSEIESEMIEDVEVKWKKMENEERLKIQYEHQDFLKNEVHNATQTLRLKKDSLIIAEREELMRNVNREITELQKAIKSELEADEQTIIAGVKNELQASLNRISKASRKQRKKKNKGGSGSRSRDVDDDDLERLAEIVSEREEVVQRNLLNYVRSTRLRAINPPASKNSNNNNKNNNSKHAEVADSDERRRQRQEGMFMYSQTTTTTTPIPKVSIKNLHENYTLLEKRYDYACGVLDREVKELNAVRDRLIREGDDGWDGFDFDHDDDDYDDDDDDYDDEDSNDARKNKTVNIVNHGIELIKDEHVKANEDGNRKRNDRRCTKCNKTTTTTR